MANTFPYTNLLVSEQVLTNAYADLGEEIDCRNYDKIGIYVDSDVNDSTGIIIKSLARHTSGGSNYEIDGLSTVTLEATDTKKYYEFEVGAVMFLQLQVIATVVGASAGDVTVHYSKFQD